MNKTIPYTAAISALLIGLSACATQRPVLSSNEHFMRVGSSVAERDVDDCIRRAEVYRSSGDGGENTKESAVADTVTSSAVGAAAGGAGGAVVGRAGEGAAVGAAASAAGSLMHALLRGLFTPRTPSPSKGFVDRCLREKGYEPAGWK
jgi:outer membrane lipoprotein SlyB